LLKYLLTRISDKYCSDNNNNNIRKDQIYHDMCNVDYTYILRTDTRQFADNFTRVKKQIERWKLKDRSKKTCKLYLTLSLGII